MSEPRQRHAGKGPAPAEASAPRSARDIKRAAAKKAFVQRFLTALGATSCAAAWHYAQPESEAAAWASRLTLGALMLFAGVTHFTTPKFYLALMPSWIPAHLFMVYASGVVEALCGLLLALPLPEARNLGGWLTFLLLVAVYPANINACFDERIRKATGQSFKVSLGRLPIQFLWLFQAWMLTTRSLSDTLEHARGVLGL